MAPELMRRFLADLESGALPSTATTREVAAAFALALKPARRGRPKKPQGVGNALRAKVNGTNGRTVAEALDLLETALDEGNGWRASLRMSAAAVGVTTDAIEKMVKRTWGGRDGFNEWRRARASLKARFAPLKAVAARLALLMRAAGSEK